MCGVKYQDIARHLAGDIRVAIPISTNPRTKGKRTRCCIERDIKSCELIRKRLEHYWDSSTEEIVEVEHTVHGFIKWLGFIQTQLIGLPQQVDDFGQSTISSRR